jgi:hypothetical protein
LFDQVSINAKHAIADAPELAITARGGRLACVIAAINFNDQSRRGCNEVGNEPPERYLAAKPNAELSGIDRGPQLSAPTA